MATNAAEIIHARSNAGAFGRFADRWIFVFMAALFVAVTLLGFIPDSIGIVGAVRAGQRPPFPPILHFHAVLMGSWLVLLLVQATLVALGRTAWHRKLGLASLVLLPAIIVAAVLLVKASWQQIEFLGVSPPAGLDPAVVIGLKGTVTKVLLTQIRMGIIFPVLVFWALLIRAEEPQIHKRLMILATVVPLGAGVDRAVGFLGWPVNFGPTFFYDDVYCLLLLLPLFAYDLSRRKKTVLRAYIIWAAFFVPTGIAMYGLGGTSWWAATAPRLMGMQRW
jgi:hypothetical protein